MNADIERCAVDARRRNSAERAAKSVAPIEQAAKFVLQIVRAKVPKP